MKHLFYLNKFLFQYKWRLLVGFLFVVIQNYFRLLVPPQFRKSLDMAMSCLTEYQQTEDLEEREFIYQFVVESLFEFGMWVMIFSLLMGLFMFLMRKTIIVVSRLIEYDLRKIIFAHYEQLDTHFYKVNSTGDLMSRITEDVSKVRMYLGPGLLYFINLLTLFVLAVSYMYSVNKTLTLYALAPLPVLSLSIYIVSSHINKRSEKIQRQLAKLTSTAQEVFSGIRVVKAYAKTDQFIGFFHHESEHYKEESMSLARVNALFHPLMLLLVSLSVLLVVVVGGKEVAAGRITYGNIAEFIIYVNMLTWPFTAVGWIVSIVQQAEASQQRINEFLEVEPRIENRSTSSFDLEGHVQFKDVRFVYPESGTVALNKINFEIKKGEKVGIIGKTASGKTTIATLLLRLYDVTDGAILLDGKNIKTLNLDELRQQIAYVPQDPFLFSDTIQQNIAFCKPDSELVTVQNMAKNAAVHNDITQLPEQYQTTVGERGVTLSGGQKQRISIARALIKNPEIIIFDDCLSAVDTNTEQRVLSYFSTALKDKTAIFITHRIYQHLNFDKIIVLEDGEILEMGTPEELIKKAGYYYEILQKQTVEDQKILSS